MMVPRRTPPMSRRPKNTTAMRPVSSARVHSRAGLPPHGSRGRHNAPGHGGSPAGCEIGDAGPVGRQILCRPVRRCRPGLGRLNSAGHGGSTRGRCRLGGRPGTAEVVGHDRALQCGVPPSAATIEFKERSCSNRCHTFVYWCRGIRILSSVFQSSCLHRHFQRGTRAIRRSGHSTMSRGKRYNPSSSQAAMSSDVRHESTDRSARRKLVGLQRPRRIGLCGAVAASRLSTTPRRAGAHGLRSASVWASSAARCLRSDTPVESDEPHTMTGTTRIRPRRLLGTSRSPRSPARAMTTTRRHRR